MTAVISTTGELAACGGMDNQLTVYRLTENPAKIAKEFLGYEGFLSSCKFLSDEECVTGKYSGWTKDQKIWFWPLKLCQQNDIDDGFSNVSYITSFFLKLHVVWPQTEGTQENNILVGM